MRLCSLCFVWINFVGKRPEWGLFIGTFLSLCLLIHPSFDIEMSLRSIYRMTVFHKIAWLLSTSNASVAVFITIFYWTTEYPNQVSTPHTQFRAVSGVNYVL